MAVIPLVKADPDDGFCGAGASVCDVNLDGLVAAEEVGEAVSEPERAVIWA